MSWMDTWLFPLGAVLLGGLGSLVLVRGVFGRWFRAGGKAGRVRRCRRCQFDLSATAGHTCPECGHTARNESEHYAGRFRWPVAGLGLVLLMGAVGVAMTPGVRRDGWLHLLPMGVQVRVFHLDAHPFSSWQFSERLEGRTPSARPSSAPGGGGGFSGAGFSISYHNEDVDDTVKAWRLRAVETANYVLTREKVRPAAQLERAAAVINRFGPDTLDLSQVDRIIEVQGPSSPYVKQLVANWQGEPSAQLRAARRLVLEGDSSYSYSVVQTIAAASLESEDARLLGVFLAKGDTGTGGPSRTQFLRGAVPAAAWVAYAGVVRAGGIGTYATLVEGVSKSPEVGAAAMGYVAEMERGDARQKLAEMLVAAEFAAGIGPHLDYDRVRAGLKEGREFDRHQDVVRLINRHDPGAAFWYIELARDPASSLRDRAMYEMGRVHYGRAEALRFGLEEAWHDPTLGLWSRCWPLVSMRSWREAEDMDFVPFWSEVLEAAARGEEEALRLGLPRFPARDYPPGPPAIMAVARRLVLTEEPWMIDLAGKMADSWGKEPNLSGFASLLMMPYISTRSEADDFGEEAASLADKIRALVHPEPIDG